MASWMWFALGTACATVMWVAWLLWIEFTPRDVCPTCGAILFCVECGSPTAHHHLDIRDVRHSHVDTSR